MEYCLLQISAWIKGHDKASGSVDVSVVKTDVDDSIPVFPNPSASFSVPENSLTGTSVGSISAVDADSGQTEKLSYDLIGIGSERSSCLMWLDLIKPYYRGH